MVWKVSISFIREQFEKDSNYMSGLKVAVTINKLNEAESQTESRELTVSYYFVLFRAKNTYWGYYQL